MPGIIQRLSNSLLALRAELQPENHALKYEWYDFLNREVYKGLDFAEENEMGHGIWDKYPQVLPCKRHAPYIFEVCGPPQDGEDILEIGCGLGGVAAYCAEHFPGINSYTAVDLDEGNIEICQKTNQFPDRLGFYAQDATKLTSAPFPEVRERAERGFHRIYFLEVTPEISKEQFVDIFDQCIQYLRVGGVLMIAALTLEDEPADKEEQKISYMIRLDSPNLHDIHNAAAKHPCQVEYEDITDISIKGFTYWIMEHLHYIDEVFVWPVPGMFKPYFRAYKSLVDRGALKQFDVFVTRT